jgi:hypothetical protein
MTPRHPVTRSIWLILTCLLLPLCALGQEHKSTRTQIEGTYATYIRSQDSKNMNALLGTVTSDFHFTEADGTVHDLAFFQRAVQDDFNATKSVTTHRFDINSLTVNGDEATVRATETHGWVAAYEPGPLHTYQEVTTSQDTLIRTTSGWKIQNSKWTTDKLTKDGIPITASDILDKRSAARSARYAVVVALGLLALTAVFLACKIKKRGFYGRLRSFRN